GGDAQLAHQVRRENDGSFQNADENGIQPGVVPGQPLAQLAHFRLNRFRVDQYFGDVVVHFVVRPQNHTAPRAPCASRARCSNLPRFFLILAQGRDAGQGGLRRLRPQRFFSEIKSAPRRGALSVRIGAPAQGAPCVSVAALRRRVGGLAWEACPCRRRRRRPPAAPPPESRR